MRKPNGQLCLRCGQHMSTGHSTDGYAADGHRFATSRPELYPEWALEPSQKRLQFRLRQLRDILLQPMSPDPRVARRTDRPALARMIEAILAEEFQGDRLELPPASLRKPKFCHGCHETIQIGFRHDCEGRFLAGSPDVHGIRSLYVRGRPVPDNLEG